ncbi:unnamed protein product, partial [Strongylus vulgaris]
MHLSHSHLAILNGEQLMEIFQTKLVIRDARDSIKKSKKSMRESDSEKRSAKTFKNPVSPRFLRAKYDVPEELKICREESTDSSGSRKVKKRELRQKLEREPANISEATFMKAAKARSSQKKGKKKKGEESMPTSETRLKTESSTLRKENARILPEWGLSSSELPVEKRVVRERPKSPPTLQYSSSQSALIGGKVHRVSPPSSRVRNHSHKKSENFRLAEKSQSYLDRQISAARRRSYIAKQQIKKSRSKIKESKKAMKEQDKASRSEKTFTNPVSPKYLKAKYAIPKELQVHRDTDEVMVDVSEKEERERQSNWSSSMSRSNKSHSSRKSLRSKKKHKNGKTKKTEEDVVPQRTESYLNLVNRYAIAGRKIKRKSPLRKGLEQIREKRENIRKSRKTMRKVDTSKNVSKEFVTNPGKAPSIHTIIKRQEELAARIEEGEQKQGP